MEPESSNPSSSSGGSRGSGKRHSNGRLKHKRHRRRRHRSHSSLASKLKTVLVRFYQKNRKWLLRLLGLAGLVAVLLLAFYELEREAVNGAHGNIY